MEDLDGTGVTSELAIANVVPKPGFTDFVIYIYDQNGLLDYVCQKLNEKQVEYIDLQTWGYINTGFKGSAIISGDVLGARRVRRDGLVPAQPGGSGRRWRSSESRTRLGEDIPGDEAAGDRGIPFRQEDVLSFDWEGPNAPNCPGGPFPPPVAQFCPAQVTLVCKDCPIGPAGPITPAKVKLSAPDKCLISDVDVLLQIDSQYFVDLGVTVSSPKGQGTLFNAICGISQNMDAILDDDASASITSACSQNPIGQGGRYRTQSGTGLNGLDGKQAVGEWGISIADAFAGDTQILKTFKIFVATSD